MLDEKNTFFDDLAKKLEDYPKMKELLKGILYRGFEESFNTYYKHIEIAAMFNYIKNVNGKVAIFNRIIETWMYNLFMTEEQIENRLYDQGSIEKNQFVENGVLKMDIKPIINGTGNYYIEAQTRDRSRTDMIIDYLGTQYIIEMKIWRGNAYNERGEQQLTEYLDYYHVNKGYMLSFCFNQKKSSGVRTIKYGDKEIVEAVV